MPRRTKTQKGTPARCPTGNPCPHCDGIMTNRKDPPPRPKPAPGATGPNTLDKDRKDHPNDRQSPDPEPARHTQV